jgi:hypothetical protein
VEADVENKNFPDIAVRLFAKLEEENLFLILLDNNPGRRGF